MYFYIIYIASGTLSTPGIHYTVYIANSVTTTSFTMEYWFNIACNYLVYRYIGINPSIPFQIDLVPNVGFTNIFNTTFNAMTTYTSSASISSFSFANPYSNYKFIFYLTCLSYYGTV
jgi:hypothetical protein